MMKDKGKIIVRLFYFLLAISFSEIACVTISGGGWYLDVPGYTPTFPRFSLFPKEVKRKRREKDIGYSKK